MMSMMMMMMMMIMMIIIIIMFQALRKRNHFLVGEHRIVLKIMWFISSYINLQ